jgi:hypothetical protein
MLPGLIEIEKLAGYNYDTKNAGQNGQFAGSTRPQSGGIAGGARGEESPARARRNGDFRQNPKKSTTRDTEEKAVVVVPISGKANGAAAAGVK